MTTIVAVKVPEGASYVARVTTFGTASKHEVDVQPGTERLFYASSDSTVQVREAPIDAAENPNTGADHLGRGLTFGQAIEHLKAGNRVAREGWNGKSMWLALTPGTADLPADKFWNRHNRAFAEQNGGTATVLPTITMKTATGEILMGWLASQTDMLSSDWCVVS